MKVALGQQRVMELGGNLPESLLKYTILGSHDEVDEAAMEFVLQQKPSPLETLAPPADPKPVELPLVSPEIAAQLPPVKNPWAEPSLTGAALRRHLAAQKLTRFARKRLEAAAAAQRIKKKKNSK